MKDLCEHQRPKRFTQCLCLLLLSTHKVLSTRLQKTCKHLVPVFYSEQNAGTGNVQGVWPLLTVLWQWRFASEGSQCQWSKESQWTGPRLSEKASRALLWMFWGMQQITETFMSSSERTETISLHWGQSGTRAGDVGSLPFLNQMRKS